MKHTEKKTTEDYAGHFQRLNIKNKPLSFNQEANAEWIKAKEVTFASGDQNASISSDQVDSIVFESRL